MMTDELFHYGMPRRSGRYPWGSGKNPYQGYQEHLLTSMDDSSISNPYLQIAHLFFGSIFL